MPGPDSAYRGQQTANTRLTYSVFVTPSIRVVTTDFAPVNASVPGRRSRRRSS